MAVPSCVDVPLPPHPPPPDHRPRPRPLDLPRAARRIGPGGAEKRGAARRQSARAAERRAQGGCAGAARRLGRRAGSLVTWGAGGGGQKPIEGLRGAAPPSRAWAARHSDAATKPPWQRNKGGGAGRGVWGVGAGCCGPAELVHDDEGARRGAAQDVRRPFYFLAKSKEKNPVLLLGDLSSLIVTIVVDCRFSALALLWTSSRTSPEWERKENQLLIWQD